MPSFSVFREHPSAKASAELLLKEEVSSFDQFNYKHTISKLTNYCMVVQACHSNLKKNFLIFFQNK